MTEIENLRKPRVWRHLRLKIYSLPKKDFKSVIINLDFDLIIEIFIKKWDNMLKLLMEKGKQTENKNIIKFCIDAITISPQIK